MIVIVLLIFIVIYQHIRIFIFYVLKCDSIVSLEFKQTTPYAGAKIPVCLLFDYMFKFCCLTCMAFPSLSCSGNFAYSFSIYVAIS